MSEDSVEIVRDAFEALAEDGVEAMLPFVSPEFVMDTPSQLAAEPDTYRGHDGVRRWFDSFYEAMDEVRIEPARVEAIGEAVALTFRMTARGRTTGLELMQEASALCDVADGKVTRLEFFLTWEEAIAAAEAGGSSAGSE